MCKKFILCYCIVFIGLHVTAQQAANAIFKIIPLGIYGGSTESNLSCYMLSVKDADDYVCFDAGTLHDGIEKAIAEKSINGNAAHVLRNDIKGYLISHPHLDHVAGLIINSPEDSSKNIYGLPFCLQIIQQQYFSWKSWANFGDAGEEPQLKKYHYVNLSDSETALVNTNMYAKAFELSHAYPYKSTAFLVRHDSAYILYLGDTGADTIEHSTKLQMLWQHIAPLIIQHKLKAIFIETSFPDEQPADKLFGHLTPSLLMIEMNKLAHFCGEENLQQTSIVITHIKPIGNNEAVIKKELQQGNKLHLKLIFPMQGKLMFF